MTKAMTESGLLGSRVNRTGKSSLLHYANVFRQDIVFNEKKKTALNYLNLWYV